MLSGLNEILQDQGVITGILILAVVFLAWCLNASYRARLADKDREIDRLAADVHDLRDRLIRLWDQRHDPAARKRRGSDNTSSITKGSQP